LANWSEVREHFSRVIPESYRGASLKEQASRIVGRLIAVQRSSDALYAANTNQYKKLQAIRKALNGFDKSTEGEPAADRVNKVCAVARDRDQQLQKFSEEHNAVEDALRDSDNKITTLMGVDSRVDGTP